ncbi:hypothetical protein [Tuwongella immobilis]|uniref:Uncharacterized protein n=1 Tax=Tuwongella immobilis TaxID=692036 RepID=A0A6C2YIK0_9BACT|nr:hypothetical protein [Tuwongella immobilis]VIP00905.1 Putative uncharacterized protein OS=Rhodopseudomonas palustris (strain DX-1) GN=Rpdx1_1915 PE=4 SV=1 [Tuwongella immobilis]VTR97228.1 Putative uncharacterized protein OS=Rhodopseudomonas palustris (strain DX-1) GN=Rpdx1_1915 PE=4 SV=1 [Tuwongella immobilis]
MKRMMRRVICLAGLGMLLGGFVHGEDGNKQPEPIIVKKILSVDYSIQKINPPNLVVSVVGQVPTGGYTKPTLVRTIYVTPPEDGIQEYTLMVVPPTGVVTNALAKVKAEDTWKGYTKEAPWVKGVRILGVGKGILEKRFTDPK